MLKFERQVQLKLETLIQSGVIGFEWTILLGKLYPFAIEISHVHTGQIDSVIDNIYISRLRKESHTDTSPWPTCTQSHSYLWFQ